MAAVLAEHGGERRQHAGADEADAQETYFATTDAAGFVQILLYVLQSATGAVEEDMAGAGELDGSRGAGEKGVPEDLF